LGKDTFYSLNALEELNLSKNFLYINDTHQPDWQKSRLDRLKKLWLNYNKVSISRIPDAWRYLYLDLELLNLRNNLIGPTLSAHDLSFLQTRELTVDLSQNKITHIDLKENLSNDSHPTKTTIILDNNPFQCDCKSLDLVKLLQGKLHVSSKFKIRQEGDSNAKLNCSTPQKLAGR